MRKSLLSFFLFVLLASTSFAQWPYVQTNSVNVDILTQQEALFKIPQGESRVLKVNFQSGGTNIVLASGAAGSYLYNYRGNDTWYEITGTVSEAGGYITVPWGPAYDPGQLKYDGWVKMQISTNYFYRIGVDLQMIKTPGFEPNASLLQSVPVDFATLSYTNEPWTLAADGSNYLALIAGNSNVIHTHTGMTYQAHGGLISSIVNGGVSTGGVSTVDGISTITFSQGETDHSALTNLEYSVSGHTGFEPEIAGTVVTNGENISVLVNDSNYATEAYADNMAGKTNWGNATVDGDLNMDGNALDFSATDSLEIITAVSDTLTLKGDRTRITLNDIGGGNSVLIDSGPDLEAYFQIYGEGILEGFMEMVFSDKLEIKHEATELATWDLAGLEMSVPILMGDNNINDVNSIDGDKWAITNFAGIPLFTLTDTSNSLLVANDNLLSGLQLFGSTHATTPGEASLTAIAGITLNANTGGFLAYGDWNYGNYNLFDVGSLTMQGDIEMNTTNSINNISTMSGKNWQMTNVGDAPLLKVTNSTTQISLANDDNTARVTVKGSASSNIELITTTAMYLEAPSGVTASGPWNFNSYALSGIGSLGLAGNVDYGGNIATNYGTPTADDHVIDRGYADGRYLQSFTESDPAWTAASNGYGNLSVSNEWSAVQNFAQGIIIDGVRLDSITTNYNAGAITGVLDIAVTLSGTATGGNEIVNFATMDAQGYLTALDDTIYTRETNFSFTASTSESFEHSDMPYNVTDLCRGRLYVTNSAADPVDVEGILSWYVASEKTGADALFRATGIKILKVLVDGAVTNASMVTVDDATSFAENELVYTTAGMYRIDAITNNDVYLEDAVDGVLADDSIFARVAEYNSIVGLHGSNNTVWATLELDSTNTIDLVNWIEVKK